MFEDSSLSRAMIFGFFVLSACYPYLAQSTPLDNAGMNLGEPGGYGGIYF